MKVLVTGGAGYVGSACMRYMLNERIDAIAYDDLRTGHKESIPSDRLIVGDINDTKKLTESLKGCDAVMHFAAAALVGESVSNPDYYYSNNVAGSHSLMNAMKEANVKRMLFSSTCATYGLNPTLPMTENSTQNPSSPYAKTKLAVEWLIRDYAEAYGIGFTILRYFNAAGADESGEHGQDHSPFTHLIPIVLQVALGQRENVKIFGTDYPTDDGTCLRDYVHVKDLAQAHLLAINKTQAGTKEVFNVGTGTGNSVLEVIKACQQVTGIDITTEIDNRRAGDPPALVAEPSKLKNELSWKPKYTSIKEIIETAWKWHKNHPEGYQ